MNIRTIKSKAKEYGGTIEVNNQEYYDVIEALAPDGYIWNTSDSSILVCEIHLHFLPESRQEGYTDIMTRMEHGIRKEL